MPRTEPDDVPSATEIVRDQDIVIIVDWLEEFLASYGATPAEIRDYLEDRAIEYLQDQAEAWLMSRD